MSMTPPSEPASTPARTSRGRILIVEDVDEARQQMAETLRAHGYDVAEAADGLRAIQAVSAERFDAIVLDLVMPNVDGWQFRETQLRHPELAGIPTVIVTVHPLREPDRYALRTPNVLRKPVEDAALLAALEQACATVQQRREPADGLTVGNLFWSRRGEIACSTHAPHSQSARWTDEQWAPIPPASKYQQIVYQCQYCPGHKGPIQRRPRS